MTDEHERGAQEQAAKNEPDQPESASTEKEPAAPQQAAHRKQNRDGPEPPTPSS